jgi:NhaB family Na+:H+ antiporter
MNLSAPRFLGAAPRWYANTILALLAGNVVMLLVAGPAVTGALIVAEFIFTLAMALQCYPLAPGGLLALEAVLLGLTTPERVYAEASGAFPVILLLIFMVTAVYFMRELLLYLFSRVLVAVRSQTLLALLFCAAGAVLSAFLDALTVLAVVISVAMGFHALCQARAPDAELLQLRASLRGLLMHAAVGTTLGGVATLVGEPQNLLIAKAAGWDFRAYFVHVAPVSIPVFAAGLLTCAGLERWRLFGFGVSIPETARVLLVEFEREQSTLSAGSPWRLRVQAACAVLLVAGLGFHVAEVGLIGLMILVLLASFLGVTDEEALGEGFKGGLPFTALLVVFFALVGVIHDQDLFKPVVEWVLAREPASQPAWLFLANGLLSAISDNVFVATVYVAELERALISGAITPEQMDHFAVAVNAGTNIPSIATPNGQAAFLFLLTSALAPLLGLSYGRMVWMALPYFGVTTVVGLWAVVLL